MDGVDDTWKLWIQKFHGEATQQVEQMINSIVEFATMPSEVYNQPKPVDSIVDDLAMEAL
jgi:hypothetical protein